MIGMIHFSDPNVVWVLLVANRGGYRNEFADPLYDATADPKGYETRSLEGWLGDDIECLVAHGRKRTAEMKCMEYVSNMVRLLCTGNPLLKRVGTISHTPGSTVGVCLEFLPAFLGGYWIGGVGKRRKFFAPNIMECTLTRREALKRREISNPKKANDKLRGKREKKHYRSCFFQQSTFMGYIGFRECIYVCLHNTAIILCTQCRNTA